MLNAKTIEPNLAQPVNGCADCGSPLRSHGQTWSRAIGFHRYVEPSNQLRLLRMKSLRKSRNA
jgi:hypothetical protein